MSGSPPDILERLQTAIPSPQSGMPPIYKDVLKDAIEEIERLRKLKSHQSGAVAQAEQRAAVARRSFEHHLQQFVSRFAPRDMGGYEVREFQRELLMLMHDAMQSQSHTMAIGIETYSSQMWLDMARRPLQCIMEPIKEEKGK